MEESKKFFIITSILIIFTRLAAYMAEEYLGMSKHVTTFMIIILFAPIMLMVPIIYSNEGLFGSKKDKLTGLYTRNYVEIISRMLHIDGNHMVILLISIDDIKSINNKYGYKVGDKLIKSIALGLSKTIRSDDALMRWSGDEFIIACESDRFDNKFIDRINKQILDTSKAVNVDISISTGTSVYPKDATTFEGLIEIADGRLYKEKFEKLLLKHNN